MKKAILTISILLSALATVPASAATANCLFLLDQSTVVQTGGFAGINETHRISGMFSLTVDPALGAASFDWVDATLSESPFLYTRSLGLLFNMTGLAATVVTPTRVEFEGTTTDGTYAQIHLVVTITIGSIHLTGQIKSPCCDLFDYSLDAVAVVVPPGWTYQYFDDFGTDKAQKDSYMHSVFWPMDAFPPPEPYLFYYHDTTGERALAFMDYLGQPAHIAYCFPIVSPHPRRMVKGILKVDVRFPVNAYISQSPPGYLLYSLSSDGHNWSTPGQLRPGDNHIPIESLQGTCYVIFLGAKVMIDNLAVHLHSPPATIYVPADFPTIQQAINNAADGDVIEVAPGTYKGAGNRDIEFLGKAVTLRSANGPEQTVIDCESSGGPGGTGGGIQHRGFYLHQNEQADSVIRGFTIIHGRINGSEIPPDDMRWGMSAAHPIGAGIYCEFSSPTIVDCVVRDCGAEIGGGIGCVGGRPAIIDCRIEKCTAGGLGAAESGGRGGGIGLIRNADAKINNCIIANNLLYHNGLGAGIYARRAAAVIAGCEFSANGPQSENGFMIGGGAYASDPQTKLIFQNCIFSNNAAVAGAAVYSQLGTNIPGCSDADCPPCRVRLTNCTIAHNRLISGPWARPLGDAAVQSAASDIKIKNCIVWYNQGFQIFLVDPPADPVVYSDIQGGYQGTGNINADPLFAPTGVPDYHLQSIYGRYNPQSGDWVIDTAHSPCIDAGDPADPVAQEPPPNGNRINMGAYGGTAEASKGQPRLVFHVDGLHGSDSNTGLSRENAFATIQKAIDSSRNGDVVLVWPALYKEDVVFDGKAITVQSAADAAIVAAKSDYAFSFFAGERPSSVLRNFVITASPYGIYCDNGARPTLTNLTIAGNGYGVGAWFGADPNISNCILWDNSVGDLFGCTARYSCIQRPGSLGGPGNISRNPMFADPNNGDYHLRSRFGRFWPEHNLWVIDDVTSPCIDAGDPYVYPARERMPNGGRLNMGAFGGTPYASMSEWPLRGDVNLDGLINMIDFALVADGWLDSLPWAPFELDQPDIIMPANGAVIPSPRKDRYGF